MKNDFTDITRALFVFEKTCWNCNAPEPELHHILGRVSNSPLNAYPLCRKNCHSFHIEMKSEENKYKFLKQTFRFLCDPNNQYRFTKKDNKFMEDNRKYYEKIVKEVKEEFGQKQLL
jgi:hypothetical protein